MEKLKKYMMIVMLTVCMPVLAGESGGDHEPYTGSVDFERLKGLAGTWQGLTVMQGKQEPVKVEYRVTSAGSTLVETMFPGTPNEMISVYHDQDGKPGMTHYCAMKNRPNLAMHASNASRIHFKFSGSDSVNPEKDAHMHELTIHFIDKDTIEQDWVMYRDGKAVEATTIALKRI
jgi:hypothetical protein